MSLEQYGWTAEREEQVVQAGHTKDQAARVLIQRRHQYSLMTSKGEVRARVAPALQRSSAPGQLPAVGDWVILETVEDVVLITQRLPRTSKFSRKRAGELSVEQVVAANVDTVWIVSAMGLDVNARRFERYLTLAWESGATPVIVLTKLDLHPDPSEFLEIAQSVALGVDIHCVSNKTGAGLSELRSYLAPGQTVALLGSSGVGKSSLINSFFSAERMAIAAIREADEKGRHTTTHRELLLLPGGGLVIDTPGMREIQLWESDEGLEQTFRDLVELAVDCRFRDCSHRKEPGCAVTSAVEQGHLDRSRYESYLQLRAELSYLDRRQDFQARLEDKRRTKILHKSWRRHPKYKKNKS